MTNSAISNTNEQAVSFDQQSKIVVNKETSSSKKLTARRAIEDHLERKQLERELDMYCFD